MTKFFVTIYRPDYGDCTNGGVTSKKAVAAFVVTESHELTDAERKQMQEGAAIILVAVKHDRYGFRAFPAGAERGKRGMIGPMNGGNYVGSADSRFREHFGCDIMPVHDRFETPQAYAANCD